MDTKKITSITVLIGIFLIVLSIVYYFLFFLPRRENRIILDKCINLVQGQEKEIKSATTYNPFVDDRRCFLEAGCMQGVLDEKYKAEFDTCSQEYYQNCLNNLKAEANRKFEAEKTKRIDDCIDLYKQN